MRIVGYIFLGCALCACSVSNPLEETQEENQEAPSTVPSPKSNRPANASNYVRDLVYSQETENFVAGNFHQYDDPLYGVAIYFDDKRDYPDTITVIISPILATSWANQKTILDDATGSYIEELDTIVSNGPYQSRTEESQSDIQFNDDKGQFFGRKIHYEFVDKRGLAFNADTYYFIQKDKLINIRTSSPRDFTPDWNGDTIVKELLPVFTVPEESEYMRKLREEYR